MSEKEKKTPGYRGVRDEIKEQRQKTRTMSLKGKLEYFWDYYKFHTLAGAAVLLLSAMLIHDIRNNNDYGFYAVMLNSSRLSGQSMEETFTEYADINAEHYKCLIDTSSALSSRTYSQYDLATAQKLTALVQTGTLDAVVMDSEIFEDYALLEMFVDLRTLLDETELSEYQDVLYYIDYAQAAQARKDTGLADETQSPASTPAPVSLKELQAEAKLHCHPEDMEQPVPVGIFMADSPFISQTNSYPGSIPVFGIVTSSKRTDVSKKYLKFLWDEEIDFKTFID